MTDDEDWPTIQEGAVAPTTTNLKVLAESLTAMAEIDRMGEGRVVFAQRGDDIYLMVEYPFTDDNGDAKTGVNGMGAPIERADESQFPPMLTAMIDQTQADVEHRRMAG